MKTDLFVLPFKVTKNPRQTFNSCDSELVQRLLEIGEQLRDTRLAHSLSLDMVAAYTRIRSHLLQSLEEGRMEQLPEPVYTQGLIRRYADALGLNGEELANFFLPEPPQMGVKSKLSFLSLPQLRPTHLYLTYILLIICAINGVSYLNKTANFAGVSGEQAATNPTETNPQLRQAVVQTPTQPTSRLVSASPSTTPSTVKPVEKVSETKPSVTATDEKAVEVGIVVKDQSWVLIEVDGKTEFEGMLEGGTQRSWKAKDKVVVVAGNAGGVLVTVNNGEAKRLGEPGRVEEAVFKVEDLSKS
ncbi:RodZ family helix-turn-helix domain-containing protein [Planktothrix sp. FACHB-1365]|uniref:helix-turn-helix domain-containing protein n=1 Tax=Planktothrix sp. FACHB-1365 TaxID=2692855 RepID=UPI0016886E38|nr:RodZ family helix-turn-helix domain-containing protein [Planktothrix sp. FACHB-1365]MBD2484678.1 helix-turn-helix domain-containing protein [Planktothrix sp. FACHB-1365]